MTEAEVNSALCGFWTAAGGVSRAPTVHELWQEQERVAEFDGISPLPTKAEVLEHFAWFFGSKP